MAVPHMFDKISPRYDLINSVLSLGLDAYWRKAVCKHLPKKRRLKLLDCATGTGAQLEVLLKNCPSIYEAVGVDPAQEMLSLAAPKLAAYSHLFRLLPARAEALPFPDHLFDAVTISFGIRNVTDVSQSLREIYRTLAPQGRLIILEFSHPQNKILRFLHRGYLNRVVPIVGKWLSKNKVAYQYLSQTIATFPQGKAFESLLKQAQFTNLKIKPLTFGIVSLYIGEKGGSNHSLY